MNTDESTANKGLARKRLTSFSLTTWTVIGLATGIGVGVFFGEYCARLSVIGDVFVGLLRMTVLPFIVVSLIANLGRLSMSQNRHLAVIGGTVMLVLWGIGLFTVFMLAQSYPTWKGGSFFSTSVVDAPREFDFVTVFVPSNVFESLTYNHVPAVVLLCISVGLGLSGTRKRELVVSMLDVLARVLIRVTRFVARLTPVGVFAIAASTAGTISLDELGRLKAHIITYTFGALFLGFVVLPWLVVILTPFRYRDVVGVARNAMLTTFATGKLIIVLPILIEESERLFAKYQFNERSETVPAVDVLYPVAYSFPHVGKLLGILFVPFAAWFLGEALTITEYPTLLFGGLFSYFGGPNLAMPFLLDLMELPHDMFQLFLALGVFEGRIADALGVMHLVVFSLISACAFVGRLQIQPWAIAKYLIFVTLIGAVSLFTLRMTLRNTIDLADSRSRVLADMQLLDHPTQSVVLEESCPNPSPLQKGEALVDRIRRRGIMRVGFNEDKLPFAFFNFKGDLVGYDMDMAHALAKDLGVTIEFVRFDRSTLAEQLNSDHFDVVMSGLVGTIDRAGAMEHTQPYMDVTLGLVVRDHRARSFRGLDSLRRMKGLRIGFVDLSRGFVARLQESLPNASLIELRTNQEFFENDGEELDALLISAESGSAFTLLYPNFEVVVPAELRVKLPLFYAIGSKDREMDDFLDHWISLRHKDGTIQEYYDHWILGKTANARQSRWSIIRDVLKWVD